MDDKDDEGGLILLESGVCCFRIKGRTRGRSYGNGRKVERSKGLAVVLNDRLSGNGW